MIANQITRNEDARIKYPIKILLKQAILRLENEPGYKQQ